MLEFYYQCISSEEFSYLNVLHLMFSYGEDPPAESMCVHQLLSPIISLHYIPC